MKFKCLLIPLLITFFAVVLAADPIITEISVTNPRSGFNALRNPALMNFQNGDSLSFLYSQEVSVSHNDNSDSNISTVDITTDSELDYSGILSCSWVWQSNRLAYGIAVSNGTGDGILKLHKTSSEFVIAADVETNEGYETEESLALSFSSSFRYNSKESIGLNISLKEYYKKTEEDKDKNGVENEYSEDEIYRLSSELSLGYYRMERDYTLGIVIGFGEYGYEKRKYYKKDYDEVSETSKNISPYFIQSGGISYIVGASFPVGRIFNLFGNAGLGFPYSNKSRSDSDSEIDSRTRYVYLINFGAEIDLSKDWILEWSNSIYKFRSEAFVSNEQLTEAEYTIYKSVLGIDYYISNKTKLTFAIGINVVNVDSTYIISSTEFYFDSYTTTSRAALAVSMSY